MNKKQFTRAELIKAQKNHKKESLTFQMFLYENPKHIMYEREFKEFHSYEYEFTLSALLAMSED